MSLIGRPAVNDLCEDAMEADCHTVADENGQAEHARVIRRVATQEYTRQRRRTSHYAPRESMAAWS
jgi:hypothetical protein